MSEANRSSTPLTERQEDVIVSRMEGLSCAECGKRHQVTSSAIKRLMARATKRAGLKKESQLWLQIAAGRIPLRPAAQERLKQILG